MLQGGSAVRTGNVVHLPAGTCTGESVQTCTGHSGTPADQLEATDPRGGDRGPAPARARPLVDPELLPVLTRNRFVEPATTGTTGCRARARGPRAATSALRGQYEVLWVVVAVAGLGRDVSTDVGLDHGRVVLLGRR